MNSHYNKNLKINARKLRSHSTTGEIKLWTHLLQNRKMYGFTFLRQYSIENYIVDFICRKAKLIIEIDGYSHNFKFDSDTERDIRLKNLGYTVLRFSEKEIHQNLPNVKLALEYFLENLNIVNPPAPFAKGE